MILSTGRSYLFIHIPKTGGTAMSLALEARAMADDLMLGDTPKAKKRRRRLQGRKTAGRLWKHSALTDLEGLLPQDVMRSLFTFTMVRNPWDRVLSYYSWLRSQRFDHPAVVLAQGCSFEDFICHPQTMQSFQRSPARSYVLNTAGEERCNLFIRLEHFKEDAQPLFTHLGFSFDLQKANESQRERDWRLSYSDKSAEIVAQCCAEDIERFEYSFNDFDLLKT
ncbi:sulfotransferase family 2 domain-containing protein [Epibacterium ulvae]|uniref:sulfotransferase family 2 domain-containing protein n=1 Tax=Epibacterium ulvae TaxID=1156985 RepID=UPI002490EEEE|nr:sulfotransferase family 2 domain-containing protein [Epibacterium ulvae]